jgi:hypothetical protein
MALVSVTQKPLTGQARQFDGTLDAFLDIINARPKTGMSATCQFDQAGSFTSLSVTWANGSATVGVGDWMVFPADAAASPLALSNAAALSGWQTV